MSKKSTRIQIANDTLSILELGYYEANQHRISIQELALKSKKDSFLYKEDQFEALYLERDNLLQSADFFDTHIEVNNESSLMACERLSGFGKKIFCLNFASAKNPGGGFLSGAQAQEESLSRSSALYPCLNKFRTEFYDYHRTVDTYYSDRMIYTPNNPVFKNDEGELLEKPYLISFLTSPAINAGALKQKGEYNVSKAREIMLGRTEKLLTIAFLKGYKTLVLGAWGCGVFQNDPKEIASLFANFLLDGGLFEKRFENIVFAVLSGNKENIIPFVDIFKPKQ